MFFILITHLVNKVTSTCYTFSFIYDDCFSVFNFKFLRIKNNQYATTNFYEKQQFFNR